MTTARGNEAPAPATGVAPEWVVFVCDGHHFGMPLGRVREILEALPFTRLPGCGPVVCGLVAVRGRVVTVFDAGAALALRPAASVPGHRLILLEHGERLLALAVDGILAVAPAAATELPLDGAVLRSLDVARDELLGIGIFADRPFLAIDVDRLLGRLLP